MRVYWVYQEETMSKEEIQVWTSALAGGTVVSLGLVFLVFVFLSL